MFSKYKNNAKTIFLDPVFYTQYTLSKEEKLDIILSPSLYWVQKVVIPVKTTREAKKLLESVFDGVLLEGDYSYDLYKDGEYFFAFAYENQKILKALKDANIETQNINNIYFAQKELQNIDGAFEINKKQVIYKKDGIIMLLPPSLKGDDEYEELDLSHIQLSKHTIKLKYKKSYKKNITQSDLKLLKPIMLVFILSMMFFAQYYITSQQTTEIVKKTQNLFASNHLKSTTIQNKSMLLRYTNIQKRQDNIREYLSTLLSFRLTQDEHISKIKLNGNTLRVELENTTPNTQTYIQKRLAKKHIKYTIDTKQNKTILEISI